MIYFRRYKRRVLSGSLPTNRQKMKNIIFKKTKVSTTLLKLLQIRLAYKVKMQNDGVKSSCFKSKRFQMRP